MARAWPAGNDVRGGNACRGVPWEVVCRGSRLRISITWQVEQGQSGAEQGSSGWVVLPGCSSGQHAVDVSTAKSAAATWLIPVNVQSVIMRNMRVMMRRKKFMRKPYTNLEQFVKGLCARCREQSSLFVNFGMFNI